MTPALDTPTVKRRMFGVGRTAVLVMLLIFVLAPLYWTVKTSLTPLEDAFQFPPEFLPENPTLGAYERLAHNSTMLGYLRNSLIISFGSAILAVVVTAHAAFAISKFRFWGRKGILFVFLAGQMLPETLLLITLYLMYDSLGILANYLALILAFCAFTIPLCTFMLKSYFDRLPHALIEAARLDGAGNLRILWRIIIPLSYPALIAAALFAFIRSWDDFIFALVLGGHSKTTLPPGLVLQFSGEFRSQWPDMMAASFLTALPVMVCFMILQKAFVAGLSSGALKG